MSASERAHYERLLAKAGFFELPARCVCGLPDVIQCRVHIHAHGREHEVTTDEQSASRPLWEIVVRVLAIEA